MPLTGVAPPTTLPAAGQRPTSGQYAGWSAQDILDSMYARGFNQEGLDLVYAMRGLGQAPTVPADMAASGAHRGPGRAAGQWLDSSGHIIRNAPGDWANFRETVSGQAYEPFNHYNVGNWLGVAGLIAGTAGAFSGAGAGAAAEGAGGAAGGAGAGASGSTGAGLGIFSNGGTAGLAGVGGGSAGALASSGAIAGGAGVGGTAGALGSLGGASNLLGSGGSMGTSDWINLAGQLYGAYNQYQGSRDAANASAAGSQAGIREIARQYDQNRTDQMPWLQAGTAALGRLNDPNAFTTSPGYGFARDEALGAVNNSLAARGGLYSGNAGRALEDRAANLASGEYNNWWNQQASLAGLGQTTAQSLGTSGANAATNTANLLGQQGNARASGIEGQTNALTGGISDFLSWYNRRRNGG